VGGSGEGGVSEPELRESIVEALLAHERAGYTESKRSALTARSTSHLINSYGDMIEKHGESEKEEVSKVKGMIEEYKGEGEKPETKSKKDEYIDEILELAPHLDRSELEDTSESDLKHALGMLKGSEESEVKPESKETGTKSSASAKAATKAEKMYKQTSIAKLKQAVDDLGVVDPDKYSRAGCVITIAIKDNKELYEDLMRTVKSPGKSPESIESLNDMHPTELAFRAFALNVKGWQFMTAKQLKSAIADKCDLKMKDSTAVRKLKQKQKQNQKLKNRKNLLLQKQKYIGSKIVLCNTIKRPNKQLKTMIKK
jgi:hypothetical protein